jgi:hypothetical protein
LKKPSLERLQVLFGNRKDPYDCYSALDIVHKGFSYKPLYFFLVAEKLSRYDRNISPAFPEMQKLIKQTAEKYDIGMHPSWHSNENEQALLTEKRTLENITGNKISQSRQHYIKFELPVTYRNLIKYGIETDHSMGYGSINGFRASTSAAFYWYDLAEDKTTKLLVQPFCFMDANAYYEQRQDTATTASELIHYENVCRETKGIFSFIFHNNLLGTDPAFKGWMEMYLGFGNNFFAGSADAKVYQENACECYQRSPKNMNG